MAVAAGTDRRLPDPLVSGCQILVRLLTYLLVGHFVAIPAMAAGEASTMAAASPFALEPEMARWARDVVGRERTPERILSRLTAALRDLGVQEAELETGTAREVFHSRRTNCAGFAFLAGGLARSLGVAAVVVEVSDVIRDERQGGFAIHQRHLAIGVWERGVLHVVDREGVLSPARHRFRVLEDRTAVAIYHSNRGAELLLAGRLDEALKHLRRAVEVDPSLEPAQDNLQVACRRAGDEATVAGCRRASVRASMNRPAP